MCENRGYNIRYLYFKTKKVICVCCVCVCVCEQFITKSTHRINSVLYYQRHLHLKSKNYNFVF